MRVVLAQINPTVGDIEGNIRRILEEIREGGRAGADLIALPELTLTGYPPRDLLQRTSFIRRNMEAVERVAAASGDAYLAFGYVDSSYLDGTGRLRNAMALCRRGRVIRRYFKRLLPTYDVLDEARHLHPGDEAAVEILSTRGRDWRLGLTLCEDLWHDLQFEDLVRYGVDPIAETAHAGAEVILNISASPFYTGKQRDRETLFGRQMKRHGCWLLYCAQVGGQDDILFDGPSLVIAPDGRLMARAAAFREDRLVVDLPAEWNPSAGQSGAIAPYPEPLDASREAILLGLRDYLRRTGFTDVALGLSGGIDSAVAAVLAAEALGAKRVHGVAMPSRYSSEHSLADAAALAEALGIDFRIVPIEGMHSAVERALAKDFEGTIPGVAEENAQARLRGMLLMSLANKFNWLVLATGNKSELATGYCTLYGDMCGALAPLGDVYKTQVYALARRINERAGREVIPRYTMTRPPSAELKANQTDQDRLPPYDVLDGMLVPILEQGRSLSELVQMGFDAAVARDVLKMVHRNEHKRRQAPVIFKLTRRAFGSGWRIPLASKNVAEDDPAGPTP